MPAAKSKTATPAQDEVDELFGEAGAASDNDDDFDDLLDQVVEDDSEGWVPAEKGEGIAGEVVKVGHTNSDFAKEGEDPRCPTVTILTKDGDKFRVIGYGAVLRRELLDANPRISDRIAVKFFGEKPIKKGRFQGKPYRHFGVAIKRTPGSENQLSLGEAMAKSQ